MSTRPHVRLDPATGQLWLREHGETLQDEPYSWWQPETGHVTDTPPGVPAVVLTEDDADELARALYEEEATRIHASHPDNADTSLRLDLLKDAAGACRDQAPRAIRQLIAAREVTT